jgi:hypothetical protein
LDRERCQLEGGDPPFGPRLQRHNLGRAEIQPHHLVEVRGGLLRGEAQVGRTDFDEFATRP